MNAMPSDFPFMSTGFATYPVPPQFGQSFGLTPLPLIVEEILHDEQANVAANFLVLRNANKDLRYATRKGEKILEAEVPEPVTVQRSAFIGVSPAHGPANSTEKSYNHNAFEVERLLPQFHAGGRHSALER
jgi:hypothetical protein